MKLSAGAKLVSAVCGMQAIVIKAPVMDGVLACGGEPMREAGGAVSDLPQLTAAQPGNALIGKRYFDEASGLELLCTKAGKGTLSFDGRVLGLKEAKPLPSSD